MLELKDIRKNYLSGENTVYALKGINLRFRKSEFVSILGPSGCGKTTMLNIIGGLDSYTGGDLLINGKSTKSFKDRDWDTYRNHSIGFVFQSYNLIPHQTVLQNVELALTLSGVSKSERRKRAKEALQEVGLGNQLHKKPGEMSGGQMQRVAIARALVNNPDIILADEPTGALDTKTSVQIMEILNAVARKRLVIMVTHNPELAEKYSTRIIRMLDGQVTDDSMPLTDKEILAEEADDKTTREKRSKGKKKPSMSLRTSFALSLKNLFTKKGRTALTSFAGSIGIIGISLIYAISQGTTNYINDIQEETLSSYPLTIQQTSTDLTSLMETFMNINNSDSSHDNDAVYQKSAIYDLVNAMSKSNETHNDLKAFKAYIEQENSDENSALHDALNGVQYSYDFDMLIYTKNTDGEIILTDTEKLMREIFAENMNMDLSQTDSSSSSMMTSMSSLSMGSSSKLWQEMLPGDDGQLISPLLENQYDVIYGSWPESYNEIVLVLDENNELNDLSLYALGLLSKEDVNKIMSAAINGTEVERNDDLKWSYEEICNLEFITVLNSDCYSYDKNTGLYNDIRETDTGLNYLYDNGIPLKVTGIIRPKEDTSAAMLTSPIGYTSELTKYIIENSKDSAVIQAQLDNPDTDVITGLPFKPDSETLTDEQKETDFRSYVNSLSSSDKLSVYTQMLSTPSDEQLEESVAAATKDVQREDMENAMLQAIVQQTNMNEDEIKSYISNMSDDEISEMYAAAVQEQIKAQYAQQIQEQLSGQSAEEMLAGLDAFMDSLSTGQCAGYYDEIMEFSDSTYEDNLAAMSYIDLDEPSAINLYASTFENKDVIEDAISEYNQGKDELEQIQYTDYVGLMMSSVTTIINAITYVLIAFVGISLIVSSIMIGVITLISVQERTKEIGILRAIGASKRNVCNMFNAETVMIGFSSGLLGVIVTYILCIPINAIIRTVTGIANLNAVLPIPVAVVLIIISMALTLLSGLIPSRSAAKKDPVVALRTE
jgi:putative ABC transport system permease protein